MSRRALAASLALALACPPLACGGSGGAPGSNEAGGAGGPVALVEATSSGDVVFTRGSQLELLRAGGDDVVLAPSFGAQDRAVVAGDAVAFWTGVDASGHGSFAAWTTAGVVRDGARRSIAGQVAAAADASRLVYLAARDDGAAVDVVMIDSAGAARTVVERALFPASADDACRPMLGFAGARALASTCADGETAPTIRSIGADGASAVVLGGAKRFWSADASGDRVLVVSAAGDASVRDARGGDAGVDIATGVVTGALAPSGGAVVYQTTDGALSWSSTSAPVTTDTFVPSGVRGVLETSPSFDRVMTYANAPQPSDDGTPRTDLELAPIPPGLGYVPIPTKPMSLLSDATGRTLGFVPEPAGARAVYVTDVSASGRVAGVLATVGANDTAPTVVARAVVAPALVARSSRVVYGVNGATGAAIDLEVVDVAATGAAAPTELVKGVDPAFVVTRDAVVYTTGGAGPFSRSLTR